MNMPLKRAGPPEVPILAPERLARGLYWDRAWSLVDGCSPCDEECQHCWAAIEAHMRARNPHRAIARRYAGLTNADGCFNGTVRIHADLLSTPIRVVKPTVWSVWTDLLHDAVPDEFILRALDTIADGQCEHHRFLILTKRPERWRTWCDWHEEDLDGPSHPRGYNRACELVNGYRLAVGLPFLVGTTVGHQAAMRRAVDLVESPMATAVPTFLSIEPLLGPLDFHPVPLAQFAWAIVGCESGLWRRPCELPWVHSVVDQLREAGVRVFVKQLSLPVGGRMRVVRAIEEFPRGLQLRELPRSFTIEPAEKA